MSADIYIFGSAVRGEVKCNSDIDVLVIMNESCKRSDYPDSWSVYPKTTIKKYFDEGRLFAWHLYLDAKCVFCNGSTSFLQDLGKPSEFISFDEDFSSLKILIFSSLAELRNNTQSEIFELGIIYTALRDIAMVSSIKLLNRPCFSRYSPYQLPLIFPISNELYESMIAARLNSTRGTGFSENPVELSNKLLSSRINEWIEELESIL